MQRSQVRMLACLLLADGDPVSSWTLRTVSGSTISQATLKAHLQKLRHEGVLIERIGGGQTRAQLRYRLLQVPPDHLLDDLLAVTHLMRAEGAIRLSPIRLVARGSDTPGRFARRSSVAAIHGGAPGATASGR